MEMKSQKHVFLKALMVTIVIFNLGIFMGYMLEHSRINKIENWYLESEMQLLDQRIQKESLDILELNCDLLVEENIKFGDKIFEEALKIQKFEDANRLTSEIVFQHKRYDLLRTLFWINSIRIKDKCNSDYHTLVYFYQYNNPTIEQKSRQRFFSKLLLEVKGKYGNNIMLIPIAGDNDISSINLLLDNYYIKEFPVIFIDEEIKLYEINTMEDIEKYLN